MLDERISEAVEHIKMSEFVRVVSHYDADGISAAAVLLSALSREGKKIHLSTEKQLKPAVIQRLKLEEPDIFVFSDLGSGQMELLNELAEATGKKIIVLDHHIPSSTEPHKNIIHINPCLEERDEDDMSGSGVSYMLARALNSRNKDLSYLAVVGAIGDIQDSNWVMKGSNKLMLDDAVVDGMLEKKKGLRLFGRMNRPLHKALEYSTDPYIPGVTGEESAAVQFLSNLNIDLKRKDGSWRTLDDLTNEEMKKLASAIICERIREDEASPEEIFGDVYTLKLNGYRIDAREMATTLNACGRMGHASIGILYSLGVKFAFNRIEGILNGYRKLITKYISWLRENEDKIIKTDGAHYILADDQIHENFIGTITSIYEKSIINDEKVVMGFAVTEDGEVKISARVPSQLVERGINLKNLFKRIPKEYGYGGGHAAAGGAFIKKGVEKEIINICESYLKEVLGDNNGEQD